MASWLKAAEDLLEVVDRRAKLVVGELSDEQAASQDLASNGQEIQTRKAKPKEKGQLKLSSTETYKGIRPEQDQKTKQASVQIVKTDNVKTSPSEHSLYVSSNDTAETSTEPPSDNNKDTTISDIENGKGGDDINNVVEVPSADNNKESTTSFTNDDVIVANSKDELERPSALPSIFKGSEISNGDHPADAEPKVSLVDEATYLTVNQERPGSETVESHNASNTQENEKEILPDLLSNMNKEKEHKADASPMKVQDQLDEAQGLLKSADKTGQSKEARLARVCAGLSSRLQEYKAENAQLEELLVAERELSSSYEGRIKQLQQELSACKMEVARAESNMADALFAKNSEIEALTSSMDALKKQSAAAEEKLASLQADMETIMRSRELTETRMIQALREELASVERRAEEERAAHSATKMAAVEREIELEHRAVEASNALARIQRQADESTTRATELEHKVALLEVECASLTQELQDMEARNRRGQKKPSEEASQNLQMQAWQEEVERARQGQREAENKLSSLEAEMQKMRVEMAGMRRDAEHYSRQEHMELEKRYRELTDLLYHKQTQLEAMGSEKAAMEFQLDKELKRFQEAQVEAERSRATRRSSLTWEEDTDIKALEPLPLHHRHMAGASMQLQKAAKLLDTGAVRATRFLWRYPVARVILLFYLVFIHLFLMYVLHRLQEQADNFASREVALSMGLGNSSLP
ncbi:golgin-84 [Phoenix dactylifera]|uniref:Golgin-84 n=1 Tax=Phoenix dactylifera TaxID=42345 RepID=A0A8B7CRA7_PHODC|nr:golgin-84 [Phoenix dactylifera]